MAAHSPKSTPAVSSCPKRCSGVHPLLPGLDETPKQQSRLRRDHAATAGFGRGLHAAPRPQQLPKGGPWRVPVAKHRTSCCRPRPYRHLDDPPTGCGPRRVTHLPPPKFAVAAARQRARTVCEPHHWSVGESGRDEALDLGERPSRPQGEFAREEFRFRGSIARGRASWTRDILGTWFLSAKTVRR
jgi:hypothetical protein